MVRFPKDNILAKNQSLSTRKKARYARGGACGATAGATTSKSCITGNGSDESAGRIAIKGWETWKWKTVDADTCVGDSFDTTTFIHFFIGAQS